MDSGSNDRDMMAHYEQTIWNLRHEVAGLRLLIAAQEQLRPDMWN